MTLYKGLELKWRKLTNLGTDDTMGFIEQKRIRTINIIIFLCLPLIFMLSWISYASKHYLLANFYIILTIPLFVMLFCNYRRMGEVYRIMLIIIITIIASIGGILFDNGQEYYILLTALLSILFYDLKKEVLYLSLFYAGIFLATETIAFFIKPIEPAVYYFKIINIIIFLTILIYFLYDIKKMYIAFLQEILSEKQKLEEANILLIQQAISLEMKNKDIVELQSNNEELSSIVYRQLRSPVAAFADILLTQYIETPVYTKEELLELSKMVYVKVMDTLTVVDRLLVWNKKGVDVIEPKGLNCEITDIIKKAIAQLQPQLKKKNLKICYAEADPLPAYADVDHVLIILLNILTNAIKFSLPNDHIKIESISLSNKCMVLISNNGKGIDKDHLKNIFSTSQIISVMGTMNEPGTGLGLKICKYLLEKNNGTIRIISEENISTTVVIELPTSI